MASCAICKKSILFGGEDIAGVRYCSKRCSEKGSALGLTPANAVELTKPKPVSGVWVIIWALIAILSGVANFGINLAGWSKGGIANSAAMAASAGYAMGPFIIAGICTLSKQYRNLHSFFKVAGILGALLLFTGLGKLSPPPR